MTHLEDGTLQAFLDDELPPTDRAEVAEHLLGCTRCHGRYERLSEANSLFSKSMAILDVEPPSAGRSTPARLRRTRSGTSSLVKAAGLVLGLAAAASAAVPGSPVHEWMVSVVESETRPGAGDGVADEAETERTPRVADEVRAVAPAGVSIEPSDGRLVIALSDMEATDVRVDAVEGRQAVVSSIGGERDPSFRTRAGRVDVVGGSGGEVRVGLPLDVEGARLEIDGRLHAETVDGELRVHGGGDASGQDEEPGEGTGRP